MNENQKLLEIKNLSIEFHKGNEVNEAVQNISFSVNRGQTLGIVGESGSGKSVTALSILKLLPPNAKITHGQMLFSLSNEVLDLRRLPEKQMEKIRGKEISMIFQEPMTSLNPVLTCGYQIEEAFFIHFGKKRSYRDETIELLKEVKIDTPEMIYRAYPHQISGGQKQRVMIAMALAASPSLVIADEPTTALDVTVQKGILDLLSEIQKKRNMSMIFISHDLAVMKEISDYLAVMYKGKIVEYGATLDVLNNPQHPYTQALLSCRPKPGFYPRRLPVLADFLTISKKGEFEFHRKSVMQQQVQEKHTPPKEKILLKVEHLNLWYPEKKNFWGKTIAWKKAVEDVSFELFSGESLGLVGESGCGKSTLSKTILQLLTPDSGKIYFENQELTSLSSLQLRKIRKDMQIVFQDPYSSLNPRMTIGKAITEPLWYHRIYPTYAQCKEKAIELLEKVGLSPEHFDRYPHEFSGGQRQRICIARAIALKPKFIICDESVSALDVSVQAQVLNLLNDLKEEYKLSYLFISHDLNVVQYFCDRIMVMFNGKIVETGDTLELMRNPKVAYTRQLLDSIPKL